VVEEESQFHSFLLVRAAGFKPASLRRQPGVFRKPAEAGWRGEKKEERLRVAGHHRLEAGGKYRPAEAGHGGADG